MNAINTIIVLKMAKIQKKVIKKEKPDPRLVEIGERLKAIRINRGYTSYESFAWDHKLNRMQYWRMETGKNFTFLSLIKILDALDLTLEDFFQRN